MGPTWVLSAPDGPHVGPMNLAIRFYLRNWPNSPLFIQYVVNRGNNLLVPRKMLILRQNHGMAWCFRVFAYGLTTVKSSQKTRTIYIIAHNISTRSEEFSNYLHLAATRNTPLHNIIVPCPVESNKHELNHVQLLPAHTNADYKSIIFNVSALFMNRYASMQFFRGFFKSA